MEEGAQRRNMRAHLTGNPDSGRWAAKLLQLGHGNLKTNAEDKMDLTRLGANVVNSSEELQSKIYPNLEENYRKSEWLRDRCILAPRNDIVEKINTSLMDKVPGESVVYRSFDQTTEESEACTYPTDVLNSFNPPAGTQGGLFNHTSAQPGRTMAHERHQTYSETPDEERHRCHHIDRGGGRRRRADTKDWPDPLNFSSSSSSGCSFQ